MRKFILLVLISLTIYIPSVKADLVVDTDTYIERVGTEIGALKETLANFNNYLETNLNAVAESLDVDSFEQIGQAMKSKNYMQAFTLLEAAIDDENFSNIGLASQINQYLTLKSDLISFVDANKRALVSDDYLGCSLDLLDQIKTSFESIKSTLSKTVEDVGKVLSRRLELDLEANKNTNINEFSEVVIEYENLGKLLSQVNASLESSFGDYEPVFAVLGYSLGASEETFTVIMKRKIRNDITNAIEKIEDSLKAKINEFIQARWGVLEDKVDEIVNGEETILEKNEEIYDKIDQVENVNDKFVNAINELIGSLDINAIKEKLNSILRRGTSEFAAAIEYLENHLVRSEYDIEVVNNQSEEIDINRAKEILILDRLFTPNELMEHLELVNDLGTLEIDANNRNKVPNKARILVKDNGEVQKEYDVVVKGDINNNGAITVTDVILAAYYSLESIELDEYEILAADINNNKKVTVTDVYLIAMKALEGGN